MILISILRDISAIHGYIGCIIFNEQLCELGLKTSIRPQTIDSLSMFNVLSKR